jgi:hypothetical protein
MQPTSTSHTEISFRTQPARPLRVMGERITPQVDRALCVAAFEGDPSAHRRGRHLR